MGDIELGDKVTDRITGYTGTAVAAITYLDGTTSIAIQPRGLDRDGKTLPWEYFNDKRVVRVPTG
jgi:hypothetical protein